MKIGIFGKSGSGKTTVADFFERAGFFHIDLDIIGRTVLDKYPEILGKITSVFGAGFVENGVLDRTKLGELVFSDAKKLELLNSIFFEYIRQETLSLMDGHDKCVVEGAVLTDIGLDKEMDHVIYVRTSDEIAIARLMEREKRPEQELVIRLASQSKYNEQSKNADFIIETDQDPDTLYERISDLFNKLNLQSGNSI